VANELELAVSRGYTILEKIEEWHFEETFCYDKFH